MGTEVILNIAGALCIPDVDANFELDFRVLGGPFSLTLRTRESFSLQSAWDAIRNQVQSCFGVSLPSLDGGPWGAILNTRITPCIWITPSKQNGISAYLNLAFATPVTIGGEWPLGPVQVKLEPDLSVEGLLIGYDSQAGLTLSARVSYPTSKGSAAKALTGGSPAQGRITKVVSYPFPLPAQDSVKKFQVHYLGIGQRVGPDPITNSSVVDPLATIFEEIESQFDTNDPKEVLTRLAKTFYKPDRGWFIAADIEFKGFRLRVLFNDPALYGLEVTVGNTPPNVFSGLLFEILYQKLGPTLGVYYGALTLPDSMRRIPLEGFILILPGFSAWIYTNGDFRVNIGWPVGPNSIGVSVDVLTGWAGLYFLKLSSADNPGAQAGNQFAPILGFGIGFQLSAGVSLSAGPFSATLMVSATTTMQGLIAWKEGDASLGGPPDAYWFAGTFALQVLVSGSVDFAVIKASVTISFGFQAHVAFENGYKTEIAIAAQVSVRASIKIIFVTIHFSFDTQITYSFEIGSGAGTASVNGPLQNGLAGLTYAPADMLPLHLDTVARLQKTMALILRASDTALRPPQHLAAGGIGAPTVLAETLGTVAQAGTGATSPALPLIEVAFALQPTVVYAGEQATIHVVGLLLTDSPDPTASPPPSPESGTGFESLVAHLVCWLLNDHAAPAYPGEPLSSRLQTLKTLLGQGNAPPQPPFGDAMGFGDAVRSFFAANLLFRITGVTAARTPTYESGSVLPMFDVLAMQAGGATNDFASHNRTPDNYEEAIDLYFDGLGLFGKPTGDEPAMLKDAASPAAGPSMASFVFADYYLMLLRQVIGTLLNDAVAYEKNAQASLRASAPDREEPTIEAAGRYLSTVDPQVELSTLLRDFNYSGASGFASRFLLGGLQLPIPAEVPAVLAPETARLIPTQGLYLLTGQQVAVADPGSPPEASASLVHGEGGPVAWIVLEDANGTSADASVELPDHIPPAPAPQWSGLASVTATVPGTSGKGGGDIAYTALPPIVSVDLAFTTRSQTLWTGPVGNQVVIPLPGPLLAMTAQQAGLSVNLHVGGKSTGRTMADSSPDGSGTAALSFTVPITQVQTASQTDPGGSPSGSPSDSPSGTGALPFLYQIGATDDGSRELLYQAIQNASAIADISILYASADGTTLQSDTLSPDVLLTRTNLSTLNQARDVHLVMVERMVATPADEGFSPLTDAAAFLRLVWEVSVVNAEGFYLFYRNTEGTGLPSYLFQDRGQADGSAAPVPGTGGMTGSITILVRMKPTNAGAVPVPSAANCVVADAATFSGSSVTLEVLGPQGTPMPSYHSAFAPGDLGFRLDWTGQQTVASSPSATIPVDELYHLVQFQVGTSASPSSPADDVWSLPLNPLSPDSGAASPSSPVSPSPAEQVYQQVFPAYRFLDGGGIGGALSSPVVSPGAGNWYELVGRTVDLRFRLTDVFGNALAPQAASAQTGVYHDPIVNLGQWPYVHADHYFVRGPDDEAVLTIDLTFDTAALTDLTGSPDRQAGSLAALAGRYTAIAWQLGDTGTGYALGTSLSPTGSLSFDPRGDLVAFVDDIRAVIQSELTVAAGPPVGPPSAPVTRTLSVPVPFADVLGLPANIVALSVSLTASRDPERAAPNAAALMPDVVSSTYAIPPRSGQWSAASPTVATRSSALLAAGSPGNKSGIAQYARLFEDSFRNFDGAGGMLKVAERAGVATDDWSATVDTLWFLRFGGTATSPATAGIHAAFTGDLAYFGLRPLNTTPMTLTVDGKTYNDVDLDVWSQSFFEAVDGLFQPQIASAIALFDLRDSTDHFQSLSQSKQTLASIVPTGLAPVLDGQSGGDIVGASASLEQAMLGTLSSAYTVSVVVQAEANVTVVGRADDTSPAGGKAPELYGKIGSPPSSGSPADDALLDGGGGDGGNVYDISNGRLELGSGTNWPTVLVSVAQPAEHGSLTLPLAYQISYVQHDFETDEEQSGYVPSSWLKFILPGEAPLVMPITGQAGASPGGPAVIPIPLPFDPPVPVLGGQRGYGTATPTSPIGSPASLSDLIREALKWTYEVDLTASLKAQDTLYFNAVFGGDGAQIGGLEMASAATDALFRALAAFQERYPDFQKAIPEILAAAYGGGGSPPASPTASPNDPAKALADITQLVGAVAAAWPDRGAEPNSAMAFAADTQEIVQYRLRLLPNQNETQVQVELYARTATGDNPDIWPMIQAVGTALNWTPDRSAATLQDGWWMVATSVAGQPDLSQLNMSWTNIDLRNRQSANFACWVVRNAELVEGRTTNEDFVYQTATVTYPDAVIPLITRTNLPVAPADQPLASLIDEILEPLAPKGTGFAPVVNVRTDFSFALVAAGGLSIAADTPILMVDDLDLSSGATSPGSASEELAGAIQNWHRSFHGSTNQGTLNFSVTMFGVVAGQQLPLVQLDPIRIDVSDVPASWWTQN